MQPGLEAACVRPGKKHTHGKTQLHFHMIPEERTNSTRGNRSRGCLQNNPVQADDGPVHAIRSHPNSDPVDCRSAPGKNSGYAAWKLDLCSSAARNGPSQSSTIYTPRVWQIWTKNSPSKSLTLADDGPIYKTSRRQPK